MNHYSKGAVIEWVYKEMLGIKIKGENEFEISPQIGGSLSYAKGSYQSVYGKVSVAWRKKEGQIEVEVVLPPNTKANVKLFGKEQDVSAGKSCFVNG